MGENSKIEWCDHTFNPWEGCTKVSAGCANCYAEARNARVSGGVATNWGKGAPRRRTSEANWKQPIKWNKEAAKSGTRPRVFCASLSDWLDDEVPIEWLADLLTLIHSTPNLDWLLLTKRPENWHNRMCDVSDFLHENPPSIECDFASDWVDGEVPLNVWVGTTAENQDAADERIPQLLDIPARVRFLSCEPLIGPLDIGNDYWLTGQARRKDKTLTAPGAYPRIDWVICGGESGPHARPMNPGWARSLRDQCRDAHVQFLFKQWGEFAPRVVAPLVRTKSGLLFQKKEIIERVGKKAAGRKLDGMEHNAFPEVQP